MREGRRAHAGVISGVGIRPAFDPDHIRTAIIPTLHARRHPPSPPLTSGGRAWVKGQTCW